MLSKLYQVSVLPGILVVSQQGNFFHSLKSYLHTFSLIKFCILPPLTPLLQVLYLTENMEAMERSWLHILTAKSPHPMFSQLLSSLTTKEVPLLLSKGSPSTIAHSPILFHLPKCFALSVTPSLLHYSQSCNISFSFIGSFLLVYKHTVIFCLHITYLSIIQFLCHPHCNKI